MTECFLFKAANVRFYNGAAKGEEMNIMLPAVKHCGSASCTNLLLCHANFSLVRSSFMAATKCNASNKKDIRKPEFILKNPHYLKYLRTLVSFKASF